MGVALPFGAFMIMPIMSQCGRRPASIAAGACYVIGWIGTVLSNCVPSLLISRAFLGLGMGMAAAASPAAVGEYASPARRGSLLAAIALAIATGAVSSHALGAVLSWRQAALTCAIIHFIGILIIYHSPETPAYLARKGCSEDCRRVFRWLRGDGEEEELDRMIETVEKEVKEENKRREERSKLTCWQKAQCDFDNAIATAKMKEFYKPMIIVMILFLLNQWSGANIMVAYAPDVIRATMGDDVDVAAIMIGLGLQRLVSNMGVVLVIGKLKRRWALAATTALNVGALLGIAWHCGAGGGKSIGGILLHLHMFSLATGTVPLPQVLAGELFPLRLRGAGGSLSTVFLSANLFLNVKTAPLLFTHAGMPITFAMYGAIVCVCLLLALWLLPETRGRTLQEIEDRFKGVPLKDVKSAAPLVTDRAKNAGSEFSSCVSLNIVV